MAMGMAGLAFRGRAENRRNVVVAFDVGLLGEIDIAPVGLGLAREGVFKVLFGLGSLQGSHGFFPLQIFCAGPP